MQLVYDRYNASSIYKMILRVARSRNISATTNIINDDNNDHSKIKNENSKTLTTPKSSPSLIGIFIKPTRIDEVLKALAYNMTNQN